MTGPRVAVLGAGIMGSATAIFLARRGARVSLFDAAAAPMMAASRWNEGKIHLGFMYSADPTLGTARKVVSGGLQFAPLLRELIGEEDLLAQTTRADDIYLCHADSVVPPDRMFTYCQDVLELARAMPSSYQYLCDLHRSTVEPLTGGELREIAQTADVIAGLRVPERSINTGWVADRVLEALGREANIASRMGEQVLGAKPGTAGRWSVMTSAAVESGYDFVINALWEGRLPVDLTAGLPPPAQWSNRYRVSLFVRTKRPVDLPSAVIAVGPFGDIKNYNGRDLYLSWYPAGLLSTDRGIAAPVAPITSQADRQQVASTMLDELGARIPAVAGLEDNIESMTLAGGWVHAAGDGSLSDPRATLHRRSDFGVTALGGYISVDTGKYSTAPWLADRVARMVCP